MLGKLLATGWFIYRPLAGNEQASSDCLQPLKPVLDQMSITRSPVIYLRKTASSLFLIISFSERNSV